MLMHSGAATPHCLSAHYFLLLMQSLYQKRRAERGAFLSIGGWTAALVSTAWWMMQSIEGVDLRVIFFLGGGVRRLQTNIYNKQTLGECSWCIYNNLIL